jgi:hypothetical protein
MHYYSEAECLYGAYSDLYKSLHGVRPRWACNQTVEWYNQALDELQAEIDAEIERDEKRRHETIMELESSIEQVIELGAGDRTTALRWLMQADCEGTDVDTVDEWLYRLGIDYTNYGQQIREELVEENND